VFSVKEKNFGTEDYAYELSKFLGQTLRLTMDCQIELDKLEETLQYNVQSSSEKKAHKVNLTRPAFRECWKH